VILDETSVTVPFTFNDSGVDCSLDLQGNADRMISQVCQGFLLYFLNSVSKCSLLERVLTLVKILVNRRKYFFSLAFPFDKMCTKLPIFISYGC